MGVALGVPGSPLALFGQTKHDLELAVGLVACHLVGTLTQRLGMRRQRHDRRHFLPTAKGQRVVRQIPVTTESARQTSQQPTTGIDPQGRAHTDFHALSVMNGDLRDGAVFITFKVDGRSITQGLLNVLGEEALALFGFGFVDGLLFGGGYGLQHELFAGVVDRVDLEFDGAIREFTVSNSEQLSGPFGVGGINGAAIVHGQA